MCREVMNAGLGDCVGEGGVGDGGGCDGGTRGDSGYIQLLSPVCNPVWFKFYFLSGNTP